MKADAATGAVLSADGMYRYQLTRRWRTGGRPLVWVMLNPSTADATVDDATIRRCIRFTERAGCVALTVVNLYAYRTRSPDKLLDGDLGDKVGPDNDEAIAEAVASGWRTVVAWGANADRRSSHGQPVTYRVKHVLGIIEAHTSQPMLCLGETISGQPRHPLMLRSDASFVKWQW